MVMHGNVIYRCESMCLKSKIAFAFRLKYFPDAKNLAEYLDDYMDVKKVHVRWANVMMTLSTPAKKIFFSPEMTVSDGPE